MTTNRHGDRDGQESQLVDAIGAAIQSGSALDDEAFDSLARPIRLSIRL